MIQSISTWQGLDALDESSHTHKNTNEKWKHLFSKYFKGSCWCGFDKHFTFKVFQKCFVNIRKTLLKLLVCPSLYRHKSFYAFVPLRPIKTTCQFRWYLSKEVMFRKVLTGEIVIINPLRSSYTNPIKMILSQIFCELVLNPLMLVAAKTAWQLGWYLADKSIIRKKFDGEMLNKILSTTLLQIFRDIINFKVIIKSI